MAQIKSQNQQFDGVSAGVQFNAGVGQTNDPDAIEWFREHGYTVEQEGDDSTNAKFQSGPSAESEAGAAQSESENATAADFQTGSNEKTTRTKK